MRQTQDDCANLADTGSNEEGRAVPCPVDGFAVVSGDPPVLVAAAYTVTARNGLSRKWLGNASQHGEDASEREDGASERGDGASERGDIASALEEFNRWADDYPTARRRLYLVTNRHVPSGTVLHRKARARGRENQIEVEIIEASQLIHYLDHTAEGQYLRWHYLEIEPGRLSLDLMRELARHSLGSHRLRFAVSDARTTIVRDVEPTTRDALAVDSAPLICLRGPSGMGKSTLARQICMGVLAEGGIGLWIPAEDLALGLSLPALLLQSLRKLCPPLNAQAGEEAIQLSMSLPIGLVLLIDDINRLPASQNALTALRELAVLAQPFTNVKLVAPLWPGQELPKQGLPQEHDAPWVYIDVGTYTDRERRRLADAAAAVNVAVTTELISALNNDPFLCGLVLETASSLEGSNPRHVVQQSFDILLRTAAQEAVVTLNMATTPGDVLAALDNATELVLRLDAPEPGWQDIQQGLSERRMALFYALAATNRLGWIDSESTQERWRWKHDRIRDLVVGRWLAANVLITLSRSEVDAAAYQHWLSHCGLAEAWALSLIFLPSSARQPALTLFCQYQPQVLAKVVRFGLFPTETAARQTIAEGLMQSFAHTDPRQHDYVRTPQSMILEDLTESTDSIVLQVVGQITSPLYRIRAQMARLRNGDIGGGLEQIAAWIPGLGFLPSLRIPDLERAITAFARFYDTRRTELAAILGQVKEGAWFEAAVTLAGYLSWPELAPPLCATWQDLDGEFKQSPRVLLLMIWMLSRCGDPPERSFLRDVMHLTFTGWRGDQQQRQSDQDGGRSEAGASSDALQKAGRWPITDLAAEIWGEVAIQYPDLWQPVCRALSAVDHPATARAYLELRRMAGYIPWDLAMSDSRNPLSPRRDDAKPLVKPATRAYLWQVVGDEPDTHVREIAFRLWQAGATTTDVPQLESIPSDDALYSRALATRLRLRDDTAAPLLSGCLYSEPGKWILYAPLYYAHDDVATAFHATITAALEEPMAMAERAIRFLPRDGVIRLVHECRDVLLRHSETWHHLWRTEVSAALTLVRDAITSADVETLREMFHGSTFPFPLTMSMLTCVAPVLNRFLPHDRATLAELAIQSGHVAWVTDHLPDMPIPMTYYGLHAISTDEARAALSEAAAAVSQGPVALFQLGRFRILREGVAVLDLMELVRSWVGSSPDFEHIVVGAMILESRGTAEDIAWWQHIEPASASSRGVWLNLLESLRRRQWSPIVRASSRDFDD